MGARMRVQRYLWPTGLIVLVAAGYAYWSRAADEGDETYLTEAVDRGTIASVVTATGTVNPVTTVQVGTYVSGPIRAIDVDYNSPVRKGQRVAQIDPAPFLVKVQRAEANVANARAQVDKARADLGLKRLTLQRNQQLRQRALVAQEELDTAQSNYDQAVAQLALDAASVKQADADLAEARINLAYTNITSPVDGTVVSRNVDVGQTVAASFQTPTLFLIAQDLTKMQVNANVSESDIGGVHEGQASSFTVDAYPGRQFAGSVVQVRNAPITVLNVVTYDVVVAVDNPALELKPGMTATVTITTARRDDVVRLPLRALRFTPEQDGAGQPAGPRRGAGEPGAGVWLLDTAGALRRVDVQTGVRDEQYAEVLSAVPQPGERVVLARRRSEPRDAARPPGFMPRLR